SPNWVRNAEDDGSGALALKALDVAATPSGRSTNKAKITDKTNKWLNAVSSLPSDRQKTEKLAELIGKDITYDPTVASGSEPDKPYVYCMYGVFCTSTAVCQGYAHAMQYMCSLLGIDCIMVGTEIHSHAWNRVKLNGVWYETDLTWYDEDVDAGDDDPEQWINVSSQYLRSCEYDSKLDQWTRRGYSASSFEFSPSHEPDDPLFEIDFGGKKIRLPECTHTTPYMAFAEVSYSGGNAVVSWKAIDSGIDHYDVWIYNSKTGLFDDIADVNGTSYTLTSKMLGGQKSKVVIMSDDVWRTMDTDGIDIDLGHVHTYGSAEWKWTKDKSGKVTGATVTIQCTGCDRKVTTAAKITEKNGTITGTAVIDGKTYTQKYSEPPRTPTVIVKIAFGGRTVQLNCADKDAEIYYQFGSSNITTKCAHVKAGSTIFLDEPMTGTKAAMYFKSLKNGLWSPLGKWGVLNVQIDKPLLRAKGSAASGNFMIYTQTKNSYIVYTLDGSVPSIQEGIQQLKVKNGRIIWGTQGSVNVPVGRTLKAIAVRSGLVTSEVMTYTNVQKQVPAFPDPARYGFTSIKFYDAFKDYKYADMITTTTKASAISALNDYNAALKQKGFTLTAEIDGEYNSSKGYYGWYYTIKYDGKEVGIVMALLYDKTSKYELVLVVDDK
ncbi:MAG: chitobiase/beta-hexosaminidase C-terminal domain-containing protein, partial [Oscillospiraceae bacterium]|nr:chitobiase/beta-hexosaminidase C-terminal domain-containing protein [Oscillospiraceae bacterium]